MAFTRNLGYNTGVLNSINETAAVLETPRCHDTRKGNFLMLPHHTSKGTARPTFATLSEHFWHYCRRGAPEECWEWQGGKNEKGYGRIYHRHKMAFAHRVSWQLIHGPIPDGLLVLHECDNPACCNPAHLFLGTDADNAADRDQKGRQASRIGQRNGRAKISEQDVLEIRRLYDQGASQSNLASRFGISQGVVSKIVLRRIWKHIEEET